LVDRRVIGAMKRTALFAVLVVSLLAACARPGVSPGSSPDTGGSPGDSEGDGGGDGIGHPEGGDLVFSVESSGGFAPPEFIATQMPTFAMYGDGRVVMQGAIALIFPGPLLPPLQVRTLTDDGIQQVLDAVADTELFTEDLELRGAMNFVADAPDTVFTFHADDRDVTVTIYGLGTLPLGEQPQGISAAEVRAHQVLGQLNDQLTLIDTTLPAAAWVDDGWRPYEPESLRLYVRDATADEPMEEGIPEQVREWPVEGDPAAFGEEVPVFGNGTRCGVVTGEEAAAWFADLQQATQMTRWTDGGERRFAVTPRPLLPHDEETCPDLAGGA